MAEDRSDEIVDEELQRKELDGIIERIAREVVRRGLETPAVMMLELNKPLSFIASQSLLVAMPFLGAFVDPSKLERLSEALKKPENVDRLIDRIEEMADEKDAARREKGAEPS